jgi:hypothetical protein
VYFVGFLPAKDILTRFFLLAAQVVVVARTRGRGKIPEPPCHGDNVRKELCAQLHQARQISKKVSVGDSIRGHTFMECVAPDLKVSRLLMCMCAALCISLV